MKPLKLIFPLLIIMLFASCGKDSGTAAPAPVVDAPDTYYYGRLKSNGLLVEKKGGTSGATIDTPLGDLKYSVQALATGDKGTPSEYLELDIFSKTPISTGIDYSTIKDNVSVIINYKEDKEEIYASYRPISTPDPTFKDDCKIRIIEITKDYVKGTFSGTLYKIVGNYSAVSPKVITEGKFYLKIYR